MARRFLQKHGINYNEVLASVTRFEIIRLVAEIASNRDWFIHHLDVKSAFLKGPLEEIVYVTQPPGFMIKGKEYMVYKLQNALCRLNQDLRSWNKRIN